MTFFVAAILGVRSRLQKIEFFRALAFDTTDKDKLLIVNSSSETFVVSTNDRTIGRHLFIHGSFDFEKFEAAIAAIRPDFKPDLLLDIGANIGTICVPALKRGLFAQAIANEPEPFNFALLQANISINGLTNKVQAHNIALGSADGAEVAFELSPTNYGDHRIRVLESDGLEGEKDRKVTRVKCQRLDSTLKKIDPNSTLIWIDTQGFEGHVLDGAKNTLKKHPPLVIEFWPYGLKRSGGYELLKKAITEAGYSRLVDLRKPRSSASEATAVSLDALYKELGEGGDFTDLLLT